MCSILTHLFSRLIFHEVVTKVQLFFTKLTKLLLEALQNIKIPARA